MKNSFRLSSTLYLRLCSVSFARYSTNTISGIFVDRKPSDLTLEIHPTCVQRIKRLQDKSGQKDLCLRILVEGGGCAGF